MIYWLIKCDFYDRGSSPEKTTRAYNVSMKED